MYVIKTLIQRTKIKAKHCPTELSCPRLKHFGSSNSSCLPYFICQRYIACNSRLHNYYEILGLSQTASKKDIKEAYIKLSKVHHPDKHILQSNNKEFLQIKEAFDVLSNDTRRYDYDIRTFGRSHDVNRFVSGEYELNRKNTDDVSKTSRSPSHVNHSRDAEDSAEEKTLFRQLMGLLNYLYAFIFIIGALMYFLGSHNRKKKQEKERIKLQNSMKK